MKSTNEQQRAQVDKISQALRLILEPGQVTELRALDVSTPSHGFPHTESGYFDYDHNPQMAQEAARLSPSAKAIYFTPNPVNPALLARAANRVQVIRAKDSLTSDKDILALRYLLIDADPIRPAGISSTDAEHEAALDDAGADVSRVVALTGWKSIDPESGKEMTGAITLGNLEAIEDTLKQVRPVLMVVDPLQAYLGAKVDMHRANEVRPILSGMANLAERYHCAVLTIRHLGKSQQDRAVYRGLGSIDFAAAARSILLAGQDPNDKNKRVLARIEKLRAELSGANKGSKLVGYIVRRLNEEKVPTLNGIGKWNMGNYYAFMKEEQPTVVEERVS